MDNLRYYIEIDTQTTPTTPSNPDVTEMIIHIPDHYTVNPKQLLLQREPFIKEYVNNIL